MCICTLLVLDVAFLSVTDGNTFTKPVIPKAVATASKFASRTNFTLYCPYGFSDSGLFLQ
ncbi:hypothetical protein D3C85_1405160 [compost metagenome]